MTLLKSKILRPAFLLAFSEAKLFIDFSEACMSKDYRVCDKTQIPLANGARVFGTDTFSKSRPSSVY